VRPDGTIRWIRDQAFPVAGPNGRVARVVGVARDVTERQELEKQYRQAQKMEAIGQLAGGVAHDFNNLLTAIQFNTSLLQATDGLPAEASECAQDIERTVQRAAGLTRQLLSFSRNQVMQARDIELNDVVGGSVKLLGRIIGEDVGLEVDQTAEALPIHGDAGMIEQLIMNLAVNARDAMPRGGVIALATRCVTRDGRRTAQLSIRDTGSGIPPDVLSKIFEPFFTTKDVGRGTGLGLAMVHGIVEQHRGTIEVSSELGRGTEFRIGLPLIGSAPAALEPQPTALPVVSTRAAHDCTILIVEDEPRVRHLLDLILTRAGYRVHTAGDGAAGLEQWRTYRSDIDLVVTDIVMPKGMTGADLARAIAVEDPACPILFTSGYAPEHLTQDMAFEEGVNFLPKPISAARLLAAVRRRLDTG
jgi:nitrogen-specific signal transduction histidine kinase/CheY-like chemotaxis protein